MPSSAIITAAFSPRSRIRVRGDVVRANGQVSDFESTNAIHAQTGIGDTPCLRGFIVKVSSYHSAATRAGKRDGEIHVIHCTHYHLYQLGELTACFFMLTFLEGRKLLEITVVLYKHIFYTHLLRSRTPQARVRLPPNILFAGRQTQRGAIVAALPGVNAGCSAGGLLWK